MKKCLLKVLTVIVLILINVLNAFSTTRTVTFTGADTNYVTKDNVTVVKSASSGSYTISCINNTSQSYFRFNSTTDYVKFSVNSETERIDSVAYIWRAGTTDHHFLFLYGSETSLGSYLGSGDSWQVQNGGWSRSVQLSASGNTNCPGSKLYFPEGTSVNSLVMCRRLVINDANYIENSLLTTFYGRMNNGTNANYPTAYGSSSTTVIGEVVLYISEISSCTTPSKFTVSGSTVICSGTTDVTLSGSQVDVTYALYKNDLLVIGSETNGTGSALTWTVDESGIYTVKTTDVGGYCEIDMTGNAVVSIDNSGPSIVSSSLAATAYERNAVAQELSVTANAASAYQWYSNTTANNSGGTLIAGATNSSYIPSTTSYGTLYYYVIVSGPCGDPVTSEISGAISVIAPSPTISLTSASGTNQQSIKAGTAIENITYNITNAVGASVMGLPTGLNGVYNDGVFTISGTIEAGTTPGAFNYTVTAEGPVEYDGDDVVAIGSVNVKSATAKSILYLATNDITTSNDLFLQQLTSSADYLLVKRPAQANFSGNYADFDLIVLHESLNGADAATANHELRLMKEVDHPILNLKSYFYTSSARWNWGTPNNGNAGKGIKVLHADHPIFNDITFSDSIYVYNNYLFKNIQPTTVLNGGYQIGRVNGGVAIHDLPANQRLSGGNSKYLLISLFSSSSGDYSQDGLKLLGNAVEYLINGAQYIPDNIVYRSKGNGNWSALNSWESSADDIFWAGDMLPANNNSNNIIIQSPHNITLTASASAPSITLEPGAKLTINSNNTLTVTGNLNLESNADGAGTLQNNGTVDVSGSTSVQQYLTSGRNWYFTSPVSSAKSDVFKSTIGNDLWKRDVAGNAWTAITNLEEDLTPVRGYVASVAESGIVTFTGDLNDGPLSYELTAHPSVNNGRFHLVGNPYPSYLDWQSVVSANPNVMPTMWFRTKTTENTYTFSTVLMSDGNPIAVANRANTSITRFIPPLQAVWVRLNDNVASASFNVNNSMRAHADAPGNRFKAPVEGPKMLRLEVSNSTYSDEAVIYFNQNASDGFDPYDAPKMFNYNPLIPEIYTRVDNERLVINGLNSYHYGTLIPLGFQSGQANSFTLRASEVLAFDIDTRIILIDNATQTEFDLTSGESYTFDADAVATDDRFAIQFKSATGTTGTCDVLAASTLVYAQNGSLWLTCNMELSADARMTVYNGVGQKVYSQPVISNTTVTTRSFEPGVYMVKLENGGKVTVAKSMVY